MEAAPLFPAAAETFSWGKRELVSNSLMVPYGIVLLLIKVFYIQDMLFQYPYMA